MSAQPAKNHSPQADISRVTHVCTRESVTTNAPSLAARRVARGRTIFNNSEYPLSVSRLRELLPCEGKIGDFPVWSCLTFRACSDIRIFIVPLVTATAFTFLLALVVHRVLQLAPHWRARKAQTVTVSKSEAQSMPSSPPLLRPSPLHLRRRRSSRRIPFSLNSSICLPLSRLRMRLCLSLYLLHMTFIPTAPRHLPTVVMSLNPRLFTLTLPSTGGRRLTPDPTLL